MTSKATLLKQAEGLLTRRASATAAPVVLWAGLNETPRAFAARTIAAATRTGALILAVVPHRFRVPASCQAVELPAKAFRLLHPSRKARYRVMRGGRGSSKSWSIARVLILAALSGRVRILCAREFQKSIAESSHRLLADQIEILTLSRWFDVKATGITSHTGSEFLFEGLFANANKLKSLEGINICWIEEAAKVSASSWEILTPTLRTVGSSFIINFNPESDQDPVYQRFVTSPPPDALIDHMTWRDNPWFPEELRKEKDYLASVDQDAFAHVWEGECRKHSAAAVFAGKFVIEAFEHQPTWDGPYFGADWGFSQDPTVLVKCWIHENKLYIENEAYGIGVDIDQTPALFDTVPGARQHVIRADSARPETISYMQQHGYPMIRSVEKWPGSVEDGIAHLRSHQQNVIHPRCEHLALEFRLYSYKIDRLTSDVLPDLVDAWNHGIDSIRYALSTLIKQHGIGLFTFVTAGDPAQKSGIPDHEKLLVQPGKKTPLYERKDARITRTFTGWGSDK